ncbi:hypothetical protein EXS56_02130 [Candidatus Kaiserbacteria bacterium]|nr:hypothetical protein [Candidatus Kaiserbacteria bacterium]
MNSIYKIPTVLGLFFVILLGLFYVYLQNKATTEVVQLQELKATEVQELRTAEVKNILVLARVGDYKASAAEVDALLAKQAAGEVLTAQQQASLNRRYLFKYKVSGDTEDVIEYLRRLKMNVLNPELSAEARAEDLSRLALSYCSFARDEDTLRAIFTGEPFSQYWVEGDGALSTRKLLEWAYNGIDPSPRTALDLARWYVNRAIIRPIDAKTTSQYVDLAKEYLEDGDDLNREHIEKDGNKYLLTRRYAAYLYWRAFTMHALMMLGDKTYEQEAKTAYDEFRKVVLEQNNTSSLQLLPYSYVVQANFVTKLYGDKEKAKTLLADAIRLVRADPYRHTNEFEEFTRDTWGNAWAGLVTAAIRDMMDVSPEFKIFIENEVLAGQ